MSGADDFRKRLDTALGADGVALESVDTILLRGRAAARRRTRLRIGVATAACVAAAIVFATVELPGNEGQVPLASIGPSAGAAGCQAVVNKKATGNQEHKPEGTTISYADAPPAFGAHYPVTAPFERKFYTKDDRPKIGYVVHNLEHGYNLLWYDDTIAKDKDQVAIIKAIAAKFSGKKLTDKFIALPWTAEDGGAFPKGTHVAMTHWSAGGDPSEVGKQRGVWQYCAEPSGAEVSSFVKDYPYTDSPEPQAM